MEDSAISAKAEKSMHRFRVNILLLSNEGFVRFCFLYACSDPTIVLFYSCRLQLYKSLDSSQWMNYDWWVNCLDSSVAILLETVDSLVSKLANKQTDQK